MNSETSPNQTFDPVAHGWKSLKTQSLAQAIGQTYARRDGEGWIYGFVADERHLNVNNVVHGGILMAFADQAVGMVAWEAAGRAQCVTIQLNSLFVRSARPGDFIECRARVVRATSSLIFMAADLHVGGEVVLQVDGIWRKLGGR